MLDWPLNVQTSTQFGKFKNVKWTHLLSIQREALVCRIRDPPGEHLCWNSHNKYWHYRAAVTPAESGHIFRYRKDKNRNTEAAESDSRKHLDNMFTIRLCSMIINSSVMGVYIHTCTHYFRFRPVINLMIKDLILTFCLYRTFMIPTLTILVSVVEFSTYCEVFLYFSIYSLQWSSCTLSVAVLERIFF